MRVDGALDGEALQLLDRDLLAPDVGSFITSIHEDF
jgi:hypothetical protein